MTAHITTESDSLDGDNLYTYIFSFPNNVEKSTAQTIVQNEVARKLKNTTYNSENGETSLCYKNISNTSPKVQVMVKDNKYICKVEAQFSSFTVRFV